MRSLSIRRVGVCCAHAGPLSVIRSVRGALVILAMVAAANVLAVTAGGEPPLGAAFVYVRVGNAWLEQTRLTDTVSTGGFHTVLLSADGLTLFVGAENTTTPSGTVHVY
jgi:hypothetical protein